MAAPWLAAPWLAAPWLAVPNQPTQPSRRRGAPAHEAPWAAP